MAESAQITKGRDRYEYMLAGKAKVTIVSKRSGARFTYEIVHARGNATASSVHFVRVLVGPDNSRDFQFLGTIFNAHEYRHGVRSLISPDAPSAKAFAWTWRNLDSQEIEVWHSGTCSRCGRELTDPDSIARGLGPVCAEKTFGG